MKVAIYARVSTKKKGQDTDNQLLDLRRYAQVLGWTIYKEYVEEESAGTGNRSQFKQVFADAHQRRFDVLLFWSLDRFSREGALATLMYLNQLDSYGVGYKSFTEQYLDSTGLFKDALIGILAVIAKQERVRLSERTKAGLAKTKLKGTQLGRPTVDPALVEQVKRLKATGTSDRAIGRALGIAASTVSKYIKTI